MKERSHESESVAGEGVLVLEDEAIVALDLADSLEEAGFLVLGPYTSERRALSALESLRPSAAILDVNLGDGKTCEKVARRLDELGCPFLFLTGYGAGSLPLLDEFAAAPRISKPASIERLVALLRSGL